MRGNFTTNSNSWYAEKKEKNEGQELPLAEKVREREE